MSRIRTNNVTAAQWTANRSALGAPDLTRPSNWAFGANVFSTKVQRQRLPKAVFQKLEEALAKGGQLDHELADFVAIAMKEWAMERGATHFTHWFQPLTGLTAEKHDSFFTPTGDGSAITEFSGKELIRGEPDASSFPSGGIRATFEARGYTAWDPTSPAFLLDNPNGALLCIPTAFVSWTGEALDHKIPLLRSMDALSDAAVKAVHLLGNKRAKRVFTTVGPEQEYFLIDRQFYFDRPDLISCGRTLFGAQPPKGQELDDHYFGAISERILAYMLDVEHELAKLGVPIKTRHHEVAPGQYEIAPVFENSNVGCDHQQLVMQVLRDVARHYGLVCLLHEKPFAGVNGSGKHNNWSMSTDTGVNLLEPGDTPHDNLQFLFFCSAVIAAINRHQELLRASIASAGQDHRLGANEAPPAIISIFLGRDLEQVFDAIVDGKKSAVTREGFLELASVLPQLELHGGDRNRTSPFAFTGNKFEFRALGSSQSLAFPNTVLNTIVAESIDSLTKQVEKHVKAGKPVGQATLEVVKETYNANKRIVFGGDNYSSAWHAEAEKRGLANLRQTPDALPYLISKETEKTFSKYKVLAARELHARHEVAAEHYVKAINIEGRTSASLARTMLLPAAFSYLQALEGSGASKGVKEVQDDLTELTDQFVQAINALDLVNESYPVDSEDIIVHVHYAKDKVLPALGGVRELADKIECRVPDRLWPLPKYSEMLFVR